MSRRTVRRRAAVVALLAPLTTGVLVAAAGPAAAVVTEGDADPPSCMRIVPLSALGLHVAPPGSPLFVSHGYVAVIVPPEEC